MLTHLIELILILLFRTCRSAMALFSGTNRAAAALPDHSTVLGWTIPDNPADKPVPVRFREEDRLKHLYVLGATGTGKTNLLMRLVNADIERRRTLVLVDLRGDLVDRVLRSLAASGEDPGRRLLLIDLRETEHIVAFNPLSGPGDCYSRAMHVLSVLRRQAESWGVQLEETLRNVLVALAETGGSLLDIEPLLTVPAYREQVLERVTDPYVRTFFERFNSLSAERQLAWAVPVLNKVTPLLAMPQLRMLFGTGQTVSFADLLDHEPGAIMLVALAVDRLHEAAHLVGSLFVSAFQSVVMARVDRPEKDRVPVHLYVDEFETMASDRFESIVAEGRRFRAGLCLCHQNLSQLPAGLRQVIRNNVHTQVFFQTGALDAAELSGEIPGDETRDEVREQLMSQPVGEAYLVRRAEPAIRVKFDHCPDPPAGAAAVRDLRLKSLSAFGRPAADVQRELEEREARIQALRAPAATAKAGKAPSYEIRHEKESHEFSPGSKKRAPGSSGATKPVPGGARRPDGPDGPGPGAPL